MTRVYRLLRAPFSSAPFNGEGSYRYGGRWSRPGTRIAYASEHLSLAMVEYLAHVDPNDPPTDLVLAMAEIPSEISRTQITQDNLPATWRQYPSPQELANIGDLFVQEAKNAILIVPSAIAPTENNWLLNPGHPEFALVKILPAEPFQYDPRLLRR